MKKNKYNQPKISINKVYTKTGDSGYTSIVGGHKYIKSDLRIEVFGEIDYLNSLIGLCLSEIEQNSIEQQKLFKYLFRVQNELFNLGNMVATLPENTTSKMPSIDKQSIIDMEKQIDVYNANLPQLKSFVLPGGSKLSIYFHLSRALCRRCERLAVKLSKKDTIDALILMYLNRFSDLMFVLSRWANCTDNISENIWDPNCK